MEPRSLRNWVTALEPVLKATVQSVAWPPSLVPQEEAATPLRRGILYLGEHLSGQGPGAEVRKAQKEVREGRQRGGGFLGKRSESQKEKQ